MQQSKQEQEQRLARIIKENSHYTNLELNEDFSYWRKNIVEKRLSGFLDEMIKAPDTPEGDQIVLRNLRRYQDLKNITLDIFRGAEQTENLARKVLKKLKSLLSS